MAITKYSYAKQVNQTNLRSEIEDSTIITKAIDHIESSDADVDIYFKAALSGAEETELIAIKDAHIYIAEVEEIETHNAKIIEENISTGGHFATRTVGVIVGAEDTWAEASYSWPIPISFLSAEYNSVAEHEGNDLEAIIGKDTIVGGITADVAVNDTVINVQQSVIDNVDVGFFVNLLEGANVNDLGRVVGIDDLNNTITVENSAPEIRTAAGPTYVRMSVKVIYDYQIGTAGPIALGESKIGGSYLPANTPMVIRYYNNSGANAEGKIFSASLDFLY